MEMELKNAIERRAKDANCLSAFTGVSLLHIRQQVEQMLSLIGRNGIFDQYTKHDISHIDQMLAIAEWVIPDDTKEAMTPADWLMLVLAIYFHDMGMLVTQKEFSDCGKNAEFQEYKNDSYSGLMGADYKSKIQELGDDAERFLYQEYVRKNHAKRIKAWITGTVSGLAGGKGSAVMAEVQKILEPLPAMFRRDLGEVCESHHMDDLDNFSKYKTCIRYGNSEKECVNLQYCAVILRTADLLHITNDRTPSIQFRLINPTDSISIVEWQKQGAVRAVAPKEPRDKEGKVDHSLPKDTIEITAYFDKPDLAEAFFGLSAYIDFMKKEIQRCYRWIQVSIQNEGTDQYRYPWQHVDDEQIETIGFEPHKLFFTVDQDSILKMLVGHTLYNDSSVVIRELIQNCLDAVKLQYCIDHNAKKVADYIEEGKIQVTWSSGERCLTISDNGTGMTISEVESFLLTVGVSKYRSKEFQKEYPDFPAISRFGIGILTCFLIADDIDITTNSPKEKTANVINLRKVNDKYLLKKVNKVELIEEIREHGTAVALHVRPDVDISNILNDTQKWVLYPPCQVILDNGTELRKIGWKSPKEALVQYLTDNHYNIDGKRFKVEEVECKGVTLAYALRYNLYLREWEFLTTQWISRDVEEEYIPIGVCIEGIRVENSSPGYKETNLVAAANTRNCSLALTNVARSAIEDSDSGNQLLAIFYGIYAKHIQAQIEALQSNGYSLSWAASESRYLIQPLLKNPGYYHLQVHPIDRDTLQSQLAGIACAVLEDKDIRKAVSAREILELDSVLIVDSQMVASAESLLRQVQSDTTLLTLLKAVQSDITIPTDIPLFCNYDIYNVLHQYALSNKNASSIIVDKARRRIDITFSVGNANWNTFSTLNLIDRQSQQKKIHIPVTDIEISGITDEIGVQTIVGLYLSAKSPLVQYICGLLKQFNYKESAEDTTLVRLLVEIIFNDHLLRAVPDKKTADFDRIFDSILSPSVQAGSYFELLNKLWGRVDKDELLSKLFESHYVIYRLQDWYRDKDKNS